MVLLLDQDNHTVRMTKEQIAESIRSVGNPSGEYTLIPLNGEYSDVENPVLCFRPVSYPKYSIFQRIHKRLKGSVLLEKKRTISFQGQSNTINEPGCPVALRVKGNKRVSIYV